MHQGDDATTNRGASPVDDEGRVAVAGADGWLYLPFRQDERTGEHEITLVRERDGEQVRIRDAADTLIFASDSDHDVVAAHEDVRALVEHLVESGRWTDERAAKLVADIASCGPLAPVA